MLLNTIGGTANIVTQLFLYTKSPYEREGNNFEATLTNVKPFVQNGYSKFVTGHFF